ncbi:MAG: DUF4912 domain-containing protein [Thermodesulfobacteriota bacterium]|nr:DUF4912 domain-containing protein [Thermodesulfobacteriota bacterium]
MDFCDLDDKYCESQVVLLPVEPYLVHAYWDVTSNDIEKAKQRLGDDYGQSQAVLRFYDVTNIIYDGTNAHGFFDVDIDLQAKDWYVNLWSPDKSYFVDLGFKTGDDFCLSLARSSVAKTPCAWPAPKADEYYMLVAEDAENGLSKIKFPEEPIPDDLIEAGEAEVEAEIRKVEPLKEKKRPDEDKSVRTVDLPKSIQAQFGERTDFDLTEMSEKGLALGISSEYIPSTQRKNDSADCV